MTVSAWLSAAAKNSKSDDPNGHRFCDKKSVTQKVSKPMYSTASFLFSVRFVSDAALLRSLLRLVCRSSDLSIHVRRIFPRTNALLQPSLGAMTALPMTDFHRTQIALHGRQYFRNTATFETLPRACNLKCADCRSCDGFLPCPGFSPDSLVQRTRMRVR